MELNGQDELIVDNGHVVASARHLELHAFAFDQEFWRNVVQDWRIDEECEGGDAVQRSGTRVGVFPKPPELCFWLVPQLPSK